MKKIANTLARFFGVEHALTPVPRLALWYAVTVYYGPRNWQTVSEHRSKFIAELFAADARQRYGENRVRVQHYIKITP